MVVLNVFKIDICVEIDLVCEFVKWVGVFDVVFCYYWLVGGKGLVDLVWVVREVVSKRS